MHLIMFDIDGTLVHSYNFDAELFVQAIQTVFGITVTDDWNSYRNVTDSGIVEQIIDDFGIKGDRSELHIAVKNRFVELVENHIREHHDTISEIPGAGKFVETLLSCKDVMIAIATGGWEESARLKLKAAAIPINGIALASSSEAFERTKIMQLAEARASKGRTITQKTYFGDGSWDKKASKQLGYNFIAIGNRVGNVVHFDDLSNIGGIFKLLGLSMKKPPNTRNRET